MDELDYEVRGVDSEVRNFGSRKRPQYTIRISVNLHTPASPNDLHERFVDVGLISRETIPLEPVTNFRGSPDNKPFYEAVIRLDGSIKTHRIDAKDTGGMSRTKITYQPIIKQEELRIIHPEEYSSLGIKVLDWEIHNYHHKFVLLGLFSKKYKIFELVVSKQESRSKIEINSAESSLNSPSVPCKWYFDRLEGVFDVKDKIKKSITKL